MKVSHSTYMSANGSLGIMNGELEINTLIPFIPKLSLSYSMLKNMKDSGLISIDIEKIAQISQQHSHNLKLINSYQKLINILKKYFDYEYYDQNSLGLSMDFLSEKKETMLKLLSEIAHDDDKKEKYEGVFNFEQGSGYFVFNGTLLTLSPKETKAMFKAIDKYVGEHIQTTEKEVESDYQLYEKYEKIISEEGMGKIKEYLTLMAESIEDLNEFVKNAELLNNYINDLENSNIYIN